jgi:hypothetical protein
MHRALSLPLPHWPAIFRPPLSALARVRWVFCLLALANLLFVGPMLAFGSTESGLFRLTAAILAVGFLWWWSRIYARGRVHWLAVLPEGVALLLITVAVGDPVRASGVLYTGLYFRAWGVPSRLRSPRPRSWEPWLADNSGPDRLARDSCSNC